MCDSQFVWILLLEISPLFNFSCKFLSPIFANKSDKTHFVERTKKLKVCFLCKQRSSALILNRASCWAFIGPKNDPFPDTNKNNSTDQLIGRKVWIIFDEIWRYGGVYLQSKILHCLLPTLNWRWRSCSICSISWKRNQGHNCCGIDSEAGVEAEQQPILQSSRLSLLWSSNSDQDTGNPVMS